MPATQSENLQLLYQGSVKRVFAAKEQSDKLWFQFSDDYSVFDWGKMPDTIANKGKALTVMGAYFFGELADPLFWRQLKSSKHLAKLDKNWLQTLWQSQTYERLCSKGMPSHFHKLCNSDGQELTLATAATTGSAIYMEVDRAEVFRPQPVVVLGQPVYYYPPLKDYGVRRLVPLEVVFRFGMPSGSSLKERLEKNPDYARQLGLPSTPGDGAFFDRAVVEFFTKLEPKDRLLTLPEALNISTLNAEQFQTLAETSILAALALKEVFGDKGIELWDGKFEFIFDGKQLLLADSIGPDELRLIYKGVQLSKETIRQVYRGTQWELALKQAQKLAAERGSLEWKKICTDELKQQPELLPVSFKNKMDKLYGVLVNHVSGEQLFSEHPDLESLARSLTAEKR